MVTGPIDRRIGLFEQLELQLTVGKNLGIVGSIRLCMEATLKKRESLLVLTGIHISPSHVPIVFPIGLSDRHRVVFGDLVDVSKRDELVQQRAILRFAQWHSSARYA